MSIKWEHDGNLEYILDYVLECCGNWDPNARPIGNARAGDIAKAIRRLMSSRDFNRSRVDALAVAQKTMRDPERTTVCNIIANGKATP